MAQPHAQVPAHAHSVQLWRHVCAFSCAPENAAARDAAARGIAAPFGTPYADVSPVCPMSHQLPSSRLPGAPVRILPDVRQRLLLRHCARRAVAIPHEAAHWGLILHCQPAHAAANAAAEAEGGGPAHGRLGPKRRRAARKPWLCARTPYCVVADWPADQRA